MNKQALDAMDPTKQKKITQEQVRLFFRIARPLRVEVLRMAKHKKLSVNAFVTHAVVEQLKRSKAVPPQARKR